METYSHSIEEALEHKDSITNLVLHKQTFSDELFEHISELSQLEEITFFNCTINSFPKSFLALKNLKEITMYGNNIQCTKIDQLPANIKRLSLTNCEFQDLEKTLSNLSNLTSLSIENSQLKELPNCIRNIPNLQYLELNENQLTTLPSSLKGLIRLRHLELSKNHFSEIPSVISELSSLQKLDFSHNQLTQVSESFKNNTELWQLDLSHNQLFEIPEYFKNLPIGYLTLNGNQFTDLPDFLSSMNLRELHINDNLFAKIPEKLTHTSIKTLHFENNPLIETPIFLYNSKIYNTKGDFRYFKDLVKASGGYEEEKIRTFYHIANQDDEQVTQYPITKLFHALTIKHIAIQEGALHYIHQFGKQVLTKNPLQKNSCLSILGKVSFNKTELKKQLKELGIVYSAKINEKTTHVIVEKGAKSYEGIEKKNLVFLSEQYIQGFLNEKSQPYFQEKSTPEEEIQNVQALLWTQDEDSVNIGLEMVKTLGVTPPLVTNLFLVFKNTLFKNSIRNKAKKLLYLHASTQLKCNLDNNKRDNIIKLGNAYNSSISEAIQRFVANSELDLFRIIEYVCVNYELEPYWFLCILSEDKERISILKKILTKNTNISIDNNVFDDPFLIFTLPLDKITKLRFSINDNQTHEIPAEIFNLKNLTSLTISLNLTELPNKIKQLKKLRFLGISWNNLEIFPKVLNEMTHVKEIYINKNPFCEIESETPNKDIYNLGKYPTTITRK